jgi:hypothetical protein
MFGYVNRLSIVEGDKRRGNKINASMEIECVCECFQPPATSDILTHTIFQQRPTTNDERRQETTTRLAKTTLSCSFVTMSRSSNVTKANVPPSHPQEQYAEHRSFLMRSIDRNDADLAALIELNDSLQNVKDKIVKACGELTLLDMGQGKIKLSPEGDRLEGDVPKVGQELCIDFLLRMKLRRKLLNRFARRLNRVAHAMDGDDVSPPPFPRYGDLRLHLDQQELNSFGEFWERQEKARISIEQKRETVDHHLELELEPEPKKASDDKEEDMEVEEEAEQNEQNLEEAEHVSSQDDGIEEHVDYEAFKSYDGGYEKKIDPVTGSVKYTVLDHPHQEDNFKIGFGAGIGATHRSMSQKEKEAEFKRWQTSLLGRIPEQPTFEELGMEHRVFLLEERRKRAIEQDSSPIKKLKKEFDGEDKESCDEDDNDDEEEKEKEDKGSDDEDEEKEKEEKEKDDEKKEKEKAEEKDSDDEEEEKEKEEEKDSDDEEEEKEKDKDKEEEKTNVEKTVEPNNKTTPLKEEEEAADKDAAIHRVKPMSLAAVPSFYDQDLKRIRAVHSELLADSMQDHARRKLQEVTQVYNDGKSGVCFCFCFCFIAALL